MKILDGQRLVFIGDSVTDMGRSRNGDAPSEGLFEPLGKGYPHVVSGLLNAFYPERLIRITNVGNSGNTVRNLKERWQRDVIDLKPDWLSIMIGINDVWRQFASPYIPESHVSPEEYESTYEKLIQRTLPEVKGMILMTPYFMEPNLKDPMRARMDIYGNIVKKLAEKYGCIFVFRGYHYHRLRHCYHRYRCYCYQYR